MPVQATSPEHHSKIPACQHPTYCWRDCSHSQILQWCWQDAWGCFGEQGRGLQSADLLQGILNAILDCLLLMEPKKKKNQLWSTCVNDTEAGLLPLERSTWNVRQYQYQGQYQYMTSGNLAQRQQQAGSTAAQGAGEWELGLGLAFPSICCWFFHPASPRSCTQTQLTPLHPAQLPASLRGWAKPREMCAQEHRELCETAGLIFQTSALRSEAPTIYFRQKLKFITSNMSLGQLFPYSSLTWRSTQALPSPQDRLTSKDRGNVCRTSHSWRNRGTQWIEHWCYLQLSTCAVH